MKLAVFFATWALAHVLHGSSQLDAYELFNVSQAWLATMAFELLCSRTPPPRGLVATAALTPLALTFALAQQLGTWAGVAAGAQWLAFALLGQGFGAPAMRRSRAALALPFAGAALELWALRGLPQWAPIGAAITFSGIALPFIWPRMLPLRGVIGAACLALALASVDGGRARLFACFLAFAFSFIEGRRRTP